MVTQMANQTLVSLPPKIDNFDQLKLFLAQLIEKLDIVLGYRGSDKYASVADLAALNLNELQQQVTDAIAAIETLDGQVVELQAADVALQEVDAELTGRLDVVQAETAIVDIAYAGVTVAALYSQAQVQGIDDQLKATSDKLDSLLAILRTAKVLS